MRHTRPASPIWVLFSLTLLWTMIAGLMACESVGTYQKSYQVLSGSKVTMETLGTAAKAMHQTGRLTDAQLAQAKEAYEAAASIQAQFIAAQVNAVRTGDQSTQQQIASIGLSYLMAASKFINLAIQFGLIKADDPSVTTLLVPD